MLYKGSLFAQRAMDTTYNSNVWERLIKLIDPIHKPRAEVKLEDTLDAKHIHHILLSTSGLSHPVWNPVNLYLHFTKNNPRLKADVLYELGLEALDNEEDLISILYMISILEYWDPNVASMLLSEPKDQIVKDFTWATRSDRSIDLRWVYPIAIVSYVTGYLPYASNTKHVDLTHYKPMQVTVLANFYGQDALVHPYSIIRDHKINSYIAEWVYRPEKVIDLLGMMPSKVMTRREYVWDAFRSYRKVADRKQKPAEIKNHTDVEESTDKALVEYLEKKGVHIVFKTRGELINLAKSTLPWVRPEDE